MSNKLFIVLFSAIISAVLISAGCGAEAAKISSEQQQTSSSSEKNASVAAQNSSTKPTIDIVPNSPADTVRAFYQNLHDKKVRDAIFLTNLRPAIEGLTDDEMKDLQVDFEALAKDVPAEIKINGEVISGDKATVTANLPDDKNKYKIQEIKLYRDGGSGAWIIQTVDGDAEKLVKKEGRNYFFAVRIEAHQDEAKENLDRITKAEIVSATKNNGNYADMPALVQNNFFPADASNLNGYKYSLVVSADRQKYVATAEPVEYGKTGKLTFTMTGEAGKTPALKSVDKGK
jgi:hypothetical protein